MLWQTAVVRPGGSGVRYAPACGVFDFDVAFLYSGLHHMTA
jgi:hypothetical protein